MTTIKRYFSFVFCALFLFQTYAFGGAEKVDNFDVSAYKNYRFSDLFLTENEIARLNDEERTVYMVSIIHLAAVIETSQNFYVGLHDRDDISSVENTKFQEFAQQTKSFKINTPEKLKALSKIFVGQDANALIGLAARLLWSSKSSIRYLFSGGKAAVQKLSTAELSWLEKKAVEKAARLEVSAAKSGRVAVAKIKNSNKEIGIPRQAIDAEIKRIKNSKPLETISNKLVAGEKKYASLSDELAAAKNALKPNSTKIASLEKKLKALEAQQVKDYARFNGLGGSRVELNRLAVAKARSKGEKAFAVVGAGVMGYELGTIGMDIYKSTGMSEAIRDNVEQGKSSRATKHKAINGDIEGEEVTDPIKKEEGYGCLFGGYPSKLVNFNGDIRCTEPKHFSKTKECNQRGKFKCNNYGLTVKGKDLDKELCINKEPIKDLTLNCSVQLAKVHETIKSNLAQDSDEWMAYQNKVKDIVVRMETSPFMQDSEGRVRTIGSYCQTSNDLQKEECGAVMALLEHLRNAGHWEASKDRVAAAASVQNNTDAAPSARSAPAAEGARETPAKETEAPAPTAEAEAPTSTK